MRPGDNLYTCSVLALEPKTGKIKWHYQFSPNNPFDYDSVAEMVLADINVEGKPTKVLMDANRNGFFYVLDRTNGKLLAANPYVKVNWATGIDMKTGRPIETDVTKDAREGKKVVVYPSILGGKNWEPMSFNPQTGLAYANTLAFGGHYKTEPATYKAGEWYLGMDLTDLWEWGTGPRGHLKAIDPMTGKAKWEVPSDIPRFSGVLSTAGGVVFSGQLTGEFEAFDADDGKKLWQFQTGSGIEGQPVTWQQDGVQYVAVTSGYGGVYSLFSGDERLANVPTGGSLWVFAVKNSRRIASEEDDRSMDGGVFRRRRDRRPTRRPTTPATRATECRRRSGADRPGQDDLCREVLALPRPRHGELRHRSRPTCADFQTTKRASSPP